MFSPITSHLFQEEVVVPAMDLTASTASSYTWQNQARANIAEGIFLCEEF